MLAVDVEEFSRRDLVTAGFRRIARRPAICPFLRNMKASPVIITAFGLDRLGSEGLGCVCGTAVRWLDFRVNASAAYLGGEGKPRCHPSNQNQHKIDQEGSVT